MRPSDDPIDRLEQALKDAHRRRETSGLSPEWQASVMHDIRRQPAARPSTFEAQRLIWRAAAVIALVSALLAGSALTWNTDQDADAALFADAGLEAGLLGEP